LQVEAVVVMAAAVQVVLELARGFRLPQGLTTQLLWVPVVLAVKAIQAGPTLQAAEILFLAQLRLLAEAKVVSFLVVVEQTETLAALEAVVPVQIQEVVPVPAVRVTRRLFPQAKATTVEMV